MRSFALVALLALAHGIAWSEPHPQVANAVRPASHGIVTLNGTRYALDRYINHGWWSDAFDAHAMDDSGRAGIKMLRANQVAAGKHDSYDKELTITNEALRASASAKKATSLVRIKGIGIGPDGQRALVMEYVDGGKLEPKVRPANEAARLGIELLRGVRALHLAGYRHNDVHLGNIAVDPKSGRLRLLDVGNAVPIDSTASPWLDGFGAPEKQGAGVRTELYTVGAFVYYASTGIKPERGRSPDLNRIHEPALRTVVGKALEPDPARRWPTAQAFLDALRPIAAAK
jgi:serine/threonine protein kinase